MDKKKYVRVDPFTGFPEKDVKEDAPTTSTAGVAATGDDPTVVVRKKKKLYDGRTRIAKKFVERILKQREARKVTEEVELDEMRGVYVVRNQNGRMIAKNKNRNAIDKERKKYEKETGNKTTMNIEKEPVPDLKDEVELDEYDKKGIDKEIRKSGLKVGGKEAKLIHRLLKGRTKEEVELDEVLKPKDKKVIDDFVQMNKGTGAQNFTQRGSIVDYEGRSLEKKGGMGAQQIASLESDPKDDYKIKVHAKMDSRSTQSIVNYLKKSAKKYNIKVEETVKEEPMIEVNELEEAVANLFVKGDNPNQMALKIAKNAKGLGLKSAMMGNQVRVKGSQKQVNDFMRSVLGKSSMGSPTEKGASNPQIDKMLNKQLKEDVFRSNDFVRKIMEKVNDFGNEHELVETNLKVLQNIVKKKQNQKVKFKDKQATVDLFTASAIMKVYDAVKPDNKKKIEKLMNGTLVDFLKLQKFAMKQVKFA